MTEPKPTALGMYVFAGGFTIGAREHAQIVGHLEDKPYFGTEVFEANFPDIPLYYRAHDEWSDALNKHRGVDILYANPPCAIFSPMGVSIRHGTDAWKTDARSHCWVRSVEAALRLNVKGAVVESVPQALKRGREMIDALARAVLDAGYSVTYLLHNAEWLGLPQRRKRFFFVIHRGGTKWRPRPLNWAPPPTVGEALAEAKSGGEHLVLREDIAAEYPNLGLRKNGGYESLRVAWCRTRGIPINESVGVKGVPMFMLHRLHTNRHMGAFTGNYLLHPHEPRHLTEYEMKALCGYPQDYEMPIRHTVIATALAQAVMPKVGEWIMDSLVRNLGTRKRTPRLTLIDMINPPGEGPTDITDTLDDIEPHPLGQLDG